MFESIINLLSGAKPILYYPHAITITSTPTIPTIVIPSALDRRYPYKLYSRL